MAIAWSPAQRKLVTRLLGVYPAISGKCVTLARKLLPIARERDRDALVWRLHPAEGRFVLPKTPAGEPWYYHATVETEAHCVDALTGVDGTSRESYAEEHWKEPDALRWVQDDLGAADEPR